MVNYVELLHEAHQYKYLSHDSTNYESVGIWRRLVVWIVNTLLAPFGWTKIDLIEECAKRSMTRLAEDFLRRAPLSENISHLKATNAPLDQVALAILLETRPGTAADIVRNLQNGQATTITFPAAIYPTLPPGGLGITREGIIHEYNSRPFETLTIRGESFSVHRQLILDQGRGDHIYTQINGRPWREVERNNFARRGEKAPPLPPESLPDNQKKIIERIVQAAIENDPQFENLTAEQKHSHVQNILYGLFFFVQTFEAPWLNEVGIKHRLSPSASGPRVYNLMIEGQKIRTTAHLEGPLRIGDSPEAPYSFDSQRSSCITPDATGDQEVKITFRPVPHELLSYYLKE